MGKATIGAVIGGLAAGALVMYLLDPETGADRRGRVGGVAKSAAGSASTAAQAGWFHLADRAQQLADTVATHAHDAAGQVADHVDAASEAGHHAADGLRSKANHLWDRLHGHASDTADSVKSTAYAAKRAATRRLADLYDDAHDKISHLRSRLPGAVEATDYHLPLIGTGVASAAALGLGAWYFLSAQRGAARRQEVYDLVHDVVSRAGISARRIGRELNEKFSNKAAEYGMPGWADDESTADTPDSFSPQGP